MERRIAFEVPDVHCEGCAEAIHEGLDEAPGIQQVEVDVPQHRVFVTFDQDRTSAEAVEERLDETGFQPAETELHPPRREAPPWYWLMALGIIAFAIAGYLGYALYPRFDLPAAEGAALLLLAAGAGIACFFSPCAFPLLVALLARETGVEAQAKKGRVGRAIAFATALSVGVAAFLLLAGVGIALGGGALFAGVTFTSTTGMTLRAVVGGFLVLLGLIQLEIVPTPLHAVERIARPLQRAQARYRRQSPALGFGLFGFGYILGGFG